MKAETTSVATTISLEFFTGYHFISSTSEDFWYHSWLGDHNVILHVNQVKKGKVLKLLRRGRKQALRENYDPQVPRECGTCVTLKFTRVYEIDELASAKLTVYPTMASSRTNQAYQQFFDMNGTLLLQDITSNTNGTLLHSLFLITRLYSRQVLHFYCSGKMSDTFS